MTARVSLGGSRWLRESTAKWKSDKILFAVNDRKAANIQEPPPTRPDSPLTRLHLRRTLDPDMFISGILHGSGTRFFNDFHLSRGSRSEVQERRIDSYTAARDALGERYLPVVNAIVIEEMSIYQTGVTAGYKNRSAASAVILERLNVGLRRLAVHYGLLKP